VKKLNQIISVFLAMIFIVSSTGIFIYKAHCSCTGTEQVGIYLKPESCDENFHDHHIHNELSCKNTVSENCCHETSTQKHNCGCSSPEVHFYRLVNDITHNEVRFDRAPGVRITDIILMTIVYFTDPLLVTEVKYNCFDLPPKIKSAKFILLQISQLKIPLSA